MAKDLLQRYIWLVDTIRLHGRMSRGQIYQLWMRTSYSGGNPMPRRTFYNYRQAVEELFNIEIKCDSATFDYYISDIGDRHNEGVTNWLLNTAVTNELLAGSRAVADKIFLEQVPSAREFLAPVIESLRDNRPIRFDYHAYGRVLPSEGVVVEPYFLKIFRQRWYVTGRHTASGKVKTYALDRITRLIVLPETFEPDPEFDAEEYFSSSFGIVFTHGEVKRIALKVESRQARYFRDLPLHHSQEEVVHDGYSIFYYRMRISPDLVSEILSYGSKVRVLEPRELKAMVRQELAKALENYNNA